MVGHGYTGNPHQSLLPESEKQRQREAGREAAGVGPETDGEGSPTTPDNNSRTRVSDIQREILPDPKAQCPHDTEDGVPTSKMKELSCPVLFTYTRYRVHLFLVLAAQSVCPRTLLVSPDIQCTIKDSFLNVVNWIRVDISDPTVGSGYTPIDSVRCPGEFRITGPFRLMRRVFRQSLVGPTYIP